MSICASATAPVDERGEAVEHVMRILLRADRGLGARADLTGEVDDADREARAHELDADRVAGVRVDPERALAATVAGLPR